jgi:predicted ferric reductase
MTLQQQSDHRIYRASNRALQSRADILLGVCWISIAIIVAIFFADTGVKEIVQGSTADWFDAAGQILGLIATDLLLVQLVLAARIPIIDRTFGHDKAMALHQKLGKPVLYTLLGHAVALTIGYGMLGKLSFFAEIPSMLSINDIPLAAIALGLILALIVSSLVIFRKKLSYDFWYLVHLMAYLAVVFSIPHQFSVGGIFAAGTISRYYWIALYVVVGASLVVFRFVIPIIRSYRHALYVDDIYFESKDVVTVTIRGKDIHRLSAKAGQFLMWRFWGQGLWWHAHPFSLSAMPTNDSLRITVRALGRGTEQLLSLKVGTKVSIEGPYGLFTDMSRTSHKVVFLAAGIGITPIRALMEEAVFQPGMATVILRSSDRNNIYFQREIAEIARKRHINIRVLDGKSSSNKDSWLPETMVLAGANIRTLVPDIAQSDVYICGPRRWTDHVVADAKMVGVPREQVHYERFNW